MLDYGLFKVHANGRVIGICGFLIRTTAGENILIDTGFPRKYAYDFAASSAEDRLGEFGEVLDLTERNLPPAQLALTGIAVADVDILIMTHTHIDHVGGIADFPGRPILMSRAERALERPSYWGDLRPFDWPDREYLLIDADTEIGPGIRVLHVPGHAPGQLAIEVDLPETGTVLITGDAISRPSEIDEGFGGSWDVARACESGSRLMQRAEQSGAFVIYGHSPEQWPKLRKAPDFYG
ncbi:N-acyl homoserine lactonase family protein [Paracoccus suum]|uniref:N-acyl homoserine lactonase family protein n=1 Tax=Paracoccus suum TaxID=2259340 RepID=UPI001F5443B2|nr:N-acyl homoserine lactonase family protein [Paracoccus suum]